LQADISVANERESEGTLAPAPKMQPDDVLNQLMQLVQTSAQTAEKVSAMHEALLGDHGHIGELKKDIERLYRRDKETVEQFSEALKELRRDLQTSAAEPQTWIERAKGIGILVVGLGLLADIAAHVAVLRGGH
jgi:hypothetical protein